MNSLKVTISHWLLMTQSICLHTTVVMFGLHSPAFAQTETPVERKTVSTPLNSQDLERLEGQMKDVIERLLPAVVAVGNRFGRASDNIKSRGSRFASGIMIREDGLILSQYHVSYMGEVDQEMGLTTYGEPGDKVDVVLHDGRHMEAELLGGIRHMDLSLLRLLEPGPYPFASFSKKDSVSLGEWVIKLGHPRGYQPDRGTVSRIGRVVYVNPANIVTDCLIAGGDSGGPIVNLCGEIVGLLQDSYMPQSISELASVCGTPRAFIPVSKINGRMGTMLAGVVPHETRFDDHDERKREYAQVSASLPAEQTRSAADVLSAWSSITDRARGCVVEVLNANRNRVSYGTVVGAEGWILTKASSVAETPFCRLPSGEIVASRVVGIERDLDLCLLKANAENLTPVAWTIDEMQQRGTFLAIIGLDSRPIAFGILSAPSHFQALCDVRGGKLEPVPTVTTVFEHDLPLKQDQFGGPAINILGKPVGITIAGAGQHGCLCIPSELVLACLQRLKR